MLCDHGNDNIKYFSIEKNKVFMILTILFHEAPPSNRRKITILPDVGKNYPCNLNFDPSSKKYMGKCLDSSPYVRPQNHVVLPSVPKEQLEDLKHVGDFIESFGPTEVRTPTYFLRNICLTALPRPFI